MAQRSQKTLAIAAAVATLSLALPVIMASAGGGTVAGRVFDDLNSNGALDPADAVHDVIAEPGVPGVTVTAYDTAGREVGRTKTSKDGTYKLHAEGARVRIEFTGLPRGYTESWTGPDSGSPVQFATLGQTTKVGLGVLRREAYCQSAVNVAYACLRPGPNRELKTVAMTAFQAATMPRENGPAETRLATALDTGSVWGLTVPPTPAGSAKFVYTSAFFRVLTQLGPSGTGAIYRTDPTTRQTSLFADLNALFGAGTAGPTPEPTDWRLVGRTALGGLTSDESRLYVVNLHDRQLYTLPLANPSAATRSPIPFRLPGAHHDCPHPDVRPFAAQYRDGKVYVGIVCSAQSTQDDRQLRGYVYAHDVEGGGWSDAPVLEFRLHRAGTRWHPWPDSDPGDASRSAPWLTGITFDGDDMVIGLRDIFADIWYRQSPPAIPAGDILRACVASGQWRMPCHGTDGGDEFYHADHSGQSHREVGLGAVWQVAGRTQLIASAFNPAFPALGGLDGSGGLRFFSNANGDLMRAWTVYDSPDSFGIGNGMGDVEAMCDAAPLEIGDYVWLDSDRDGVQDPGEPPLPGVTVNLYDAQGVKVATRVTGADGRYVFNDANVPGGLKRTASYTIRLDRAADFASGGVLFNSVLSVALAGNNTGIDNDAKLVDAFPTIVVQTGASGQNNHTYDFGLFVPQVPSPTPTLGISGIDIVKYDGRVNPPATPVDGPDDRDRTFDGPTNGLWQPRVDADTAANAAEYDLAGATTGRHPVKFIVTNIGTRPLANVTVDDHTVSGPALQSVVCTFPDGTTGLTWRGPLAPGERFPCSSTLELRADEAYQGIAGVTATTEQATEVNDEDHYHAVVDPTPDQLAISVVDGLTDRPANTPATAVSFKPGESRPISITVNNVGPSEVQDVTISVVTVAGAVKPTDVTCTFPDGTSAPAVAQADGTLLVTWAATFGNPPARMWAASQPFTCTARLTLPAGAADQQIRVTVNAKAPGGTALSERDDYYARIVAIDIEKYDGVLGKPAAYDPAFVNAQVDGDADTAQFAVQYQAGVARPILIAVKNTGVESLSHVVVSDARTGGTADVQGLTCDFSAFGGPNSGLSWSGPLLPGAFFFCTGMLTLGPEATHAGLATVVATGAISGAQLTDSDAYHAASLIAGEPTSTPTSPGGPAAPGGPVVPVAGGPLPTTGAPVLGIVIVGLGLVLGGVLMARRFRDRGEPS